MTTFVDTSRTCSQVVDGQHAEIDAALARVGEAIGGPEREALLAHDRLIALLSQHLFGIEIVMCPRLAHALPGADVKVQAHLVEARAMEATMRRLSQKLWGDALAPSVPLRTLHDELLRQMATHRADEESMVSQLDEVLLPAQRGAVAAELERVTAHAPTRPHPHAVRRTGWSRLLYRPVAAFDRFLDTLSSRPAPRAGKPRRPMSRWGAYALGAPLPPDADQESNISSKP